MLNPEIAIDFGTSTTRIFLNGKGIVINEPSVLTVNREDNSVTAVGREAKSMEGRTAGKKSVERPFLYGRVADYSMAEHMTMTYIKKAAQGRIILPCAYVNAPLGITEVEKRALQDIIEEAGISKIFFVDETAAALMGAGRDIFGISAVMAVDIGASKTTVMAYYGGELLASACVRVGGLDFDDAAIRMVKLKYGVEIGRLTAEELKIRIGCASPMERLSVCKVNGADVRTFMPKTAVVSSDDMMEAYAGLCDRISTAVINVISDLPVSALVDISEGGIVLTGGGAKLNGMDRMIARKTQIKTAVAARPEHCVVDGTSAVIHMNKKMSKKSQAIVN